MMVNRGNMMKKKIITVILLTVLAISFSIGIVTAGKPDKPDKPPRPNDKAEFRISIDGDFDLVNDFISHEAETRFYEDIGEIKHGTVYNWMSGYIGLAIFNFPDDDELDDLLPGDSVVEMGSIYHHRHYSYRDLYEDFWGLYFGWEKDLNDDGDIDFVGFTAVTNRDKDPEGEYLSGDWEVDEVWDVVIKSIICTRIPGHGKPKYEYTIETFNRKYNIVLEIDKEPF